MKSAKQCSRTRVSAHRLGRLPSAVFLVLFVFVFVACEENNRIEPAVVAVFPSSVEAGSAQWISIEGEGFEPLVRLDGRNREIEVDDGFQVRIGGLLSERVHWSARDRLTALLPPGLPSGKHDLRISSPSGSETELTAALCAGERQVRHVAFLLLAQDGLPDLMTVDDSQRPDWDPRQLLQWSLPGPHRPVAISQQSGAVAAIGLRAVGGGLVADLVVLYPWKDGHEYDAPILLRSAPIGSLDQQEFSMPVFSRDGRRLVFTEGEGRRLLSMLVPEPGAEAEEPVVLWEEPAESRFEVQFPDIDPSGHRVVFSRVRYELPDCDLDQIDDPSTIEHVARVSLWQVPIAGGEILPILEDEGVSNGPAAFLPAGDKLVFMSDRLGMLFPIEGNRCVHSVTNVYLMDLVTGEVSPVTEPVAMAPYGPPHVSPDGRWVAVPGYLADTASTLVDLILIDLDHAEVYRAASRATGGCSQTRPQSCSFATVLPAFAPDSASVFATGVVPHLPTEGDYTFFLMEVDLPEGVLDLPAYDRTLPSAHVEFLGPNLLAARALDRYAGCVED